MANFRDFFPRMGRVVWPNYLHHVVQRGHSRQIVFARTEGFRRYLSDIEELKTLFGIRVYAFCLMTNHVHLLVEPDSAFDLGQFMKFLAARATRYRNRLEWRTVTLWEIHYKSSFVQADDYLLSCCRYIELNPVRAGMVQGPEDYPWSSIVPDYAWLDFDPCYMGLAKDDDGRYERYRAFVENAAPNAEIDLIRSALQRGQLTGSAKFAVEIEKPIGKRIEFRGRVVFIEKNKSVTFSRMRMK